MHYILLVCLFLEAYALAIQPVIERVNNAAQVAGKLVNGGIKNVQNTIGVMDRFAHAAINTAVDVSEQRAGLLAVAKSEASVASLARSSAASGPPALSAAERELSKTSMSNTKATVESLAKPKSIGNIFAENLRVAFKDHPVKAVGTVLEGKVVDLAVYGTLNNPAIKWIPKFIKNSPKLKKFLTKISVSTFDLLCKWKYSSQKMLQSLAQRMQNAFAHMNPNMPAFLVNSMINSLCFAKSFLK